MRSDRCRMVSARYMNQQLLSMFPCRWASKLLAVPSLNSSNVFMVYICHVSLALFSLNLSFVEVCIHDFVRGSCLCRKFLVVHWLAIHTSNVSVLLLVNGFVLQVGPLFLASHFFLTSTSQEFFRQQLFFEVDVFILRFRTKRTRWSFFFSQSKKVTSIFPCVVTVHCLNNTFASFCCNVF